MVPSPGSVLSPVSLVDILRPRLWRWVFRGHADMTATGYAGGYTGRFQPEPRIALPVGRAKEFVVVVYPLKTAVIERIDVRFLRRRTIREFLNELAPRVFLGRQMPPGWDMLSREVVSLQPVLNCRGGLSPAELTLTDSVGNGFRWLPVKDAKCRAHDAIHLCLVCDVARPNRRWRVSVHIETADGFMRARHNMGSF